jgi:putative ABC transport system permease protein
VDNVCNPRCKKPYKPRRLCSTNSIGYVGECFCLLGVEHIRNQAKESFSNTVSGVDLIVGARTGSLNLLLYSVFRVGSPTNNISWDTFKRVQSVSDAAWVIPISLGDSHKGYRVLGTTKDYFTHFSYGRQHKLALTKGAVFDQVFEVVLGSEVAEKLGYELGDKIILSHGMADTSFSLHKDKPFSVVGILERTGTPVDQTLHVSLQGIEAIHIDWNQEYQSSKADAPIPISELNDLVPKSITAFMVGLKTKMKVFKTQRIINEFKREPLVAILPGVTLSELWQMMEP